MVWREKGKYGFHTTGRTLRADVGNSQSLYGSSNSTEGIVLKQVRNAALLSASGVEDFTYENDFEDGIGALKSLFVSENLPGRARARFTRGSDIQYSLGKQKRWLIPEIVKNHPVDENYSESETPTGRVLLVERRVHASRILRGKGDCEAVYDSKTQSVREPRNRFAHVGDLEPKTNDPCVRYEICRACSESSWPRNVRNSHSCSCFVCSGNYRNPNKSASKNKHFRNKGDRWGHFREHDLIHAKDDHTLTHCGIRGKRTRKQDPNGAGKVRVVSFGDMRQAKKYSDSNNNYAAFDIGGYIDGLLKEKASSDTKAPQATQTSCSAEIPAPRKVFVPEPTEDAADLTVHSEVVVSAQKLIFSSPEKKLGTQLELIRSDIESEQLAQCWGELYTEGMSRPRRFVIELTTMISGCHGSTLALFEQQNDAVDNSDVVSTSVSLITACDTSTDSGESFSTALADFSRNLEIMSKDDILFTVKDVIDVAVWALDKNVSKETIQTEPNTTCKKLRTGVKAFEMLNKALGWNVMPTTVAKALKGIKQNFRLSSAMDTCMCSVTNKELCCDICFMDFDYDDCDQALPVTSLKNCGHTFCNECWETYLKTQIYEGRTPVMCPGYECKRAVDDVTIMSLVPSMYGRFVNQSHNKVLETSPEWMWCPATSCGLVIRVNNARNSCQTGEGVSTLGLYEQPLAIPCACGTTSCRLCQQEAHWPASCAQARQFQSVSRAHEAILKEEGKDLITSVQVRKCPNCLYPIEKHMGCNFMYCIMCNTSYCWNCLVVMEKHGETYSCKSPPKQSEEVSIPIGFLPDKFNAVIDIAIKNRIARMGAEMSRFRQAVNNIQRVLSTPAAQLPPPLTRSMRRKRLTSVASKLWERSSMTSHELVSSLQSLADFKYMCHFVLEGTAKVVCLQQNHRNTRRLRLWMFQLQFITDQITCLITERGEKLWLEPDAGTKLQNWCRCGRNCIQAIGKLTQG